MTVSIADELLLDKILNGLSDLDRASVERALAFRGYRHDRKIDDADEAYDAGYEDGFDAGKSRKSAA